MTKCLGKVRALPFDLFSLWCSCALFFIYLFSADKKKMKRSKWHLGIRSRSEPADIMSEVFTALKNLQMEWRVLDSPFHLKVRHQNSIGRSVSVFSFLFFFFSFSSSSSLLFLTFFVFFLCAGGYHPSALQGRR